MYDLSSKFNSFYTTHVVLPQSEQDNLHTKKNLNIQRLKDGLKEYNAENNTSYSIKSCIFAKSLSFFIYVLNLSIGPYFSPASLNIKELNS